MTTNRFHTRPRLRRWAGLLAVVTGVTVSGTAALPANAGQDHLHRFEHQTIAWHDCRTNPHDPAGANLAAVGALCGQLTVPLDYRNPDGRTISVAVARRPATDTAHRLGTLVLGLFDRSGVASIAEGAAAVAARYDVVGLDPRLTGLSTPQDCPWPVNVQSLLALATPDRASFDARVAAARQAAALCNKDADVMPFASGRNIARDTDILRSALGEHRISYLAADHDAYAATVYLQMFGQHVDRMVLDGAPDPNTFGALVQRDNAVPGEAELAHWAGWAAQRDAQYHLGATATSVMHTIQVILDTARRQPLRVGDFKVNAGLVASELLQNKALNDQVYAARSDDVVTFRDAAKGLPVTPGPGLAAALSGFSDPTLSEPGGSGFASICGNHPAPRDPEFYWRDIQAHLATEPIFGPYYRAALLVCAFLQAGPIEPATTIDNHHQALIVGATGDSHLTYAGQLALHHALHGSRLLTVDSAFNHLQYLFAGNACVDNAVQNYLLGGPLPDHDLTCQPANQP